MNSITPLKIFSPVFSLLILFLIPASMSAQNLPDEPDQWVTDYVGILDGRQQNQLNDMLKSFEDSTSNQIVVAIFQNAQGYPVEEFTIRLAEKWRVGQKDRDNGIVLAIFMEERKFRAEVGYGLEDVVPDAYAFQIVSQIMPSYFREGQYYEGIYEAVAALMQASAGRYEGLPRKDLKDGAPTFPFVLMVFILIIFISIFRRKKYSNANSRGWYHSGPFYWGGMGGGGFSRGGGGGFGGGGFSGGGGSFGGGGATGSW